LTSGCSRPASLKRKRSVSWLTRTKGGCHPLGRAAQEAHRTVTLNILWVSFFVPTIVTITANTALDHVLAVDRFAPGSRLSLMAETESIGGKGSLVSAFAVDLGVRSVALGLAAGENGRRLAKLLKARSVVTDFSPAEGETRRIVVVVERSGHRQTWLVPQTLYATAKGIRHLRERMVRWLRNSSWLVLSGSLSPGCSARLYHTLTHQAHACGARVLIDASGPPLKYALEGKPDVVKLNRQELEQTVGRRIPNIYSLVARLRRFVNQGAELAVCTLGADGAVATCRDRAWRCIPPRIAAGSSAGSGDAFTAALLTAREQGADWQEALRWGTAVGTAKALEEVTDRFDLEAAHLLLRRAVLKIL